MSEPEELRHRPRMSDDLEQYLQVSQIINWQHPAIIELASKMAWEHQTQQAIAKACFEWVRDEVQHSVDYQMNPVTCCASDVLEHRTGYCYAKSHLLAALLRANRIPAGFCYQRLSIDDRGAPYYLHGFNAVHLAEFGWYRIDPRGNRDGIAAQFSPPVEQLAYRTRLVEEIDFPGILAEPLPEVVAVLRSYHRWDEVHEHLPDLCKESARKYDRLV